MSLYLPPVALLAEGVDRNVVDDSHLEALEGVALLAEGVDRNCQLAEGILCREVALLAEGVDRNNNVELKALAAQSRPPRGGRG